MADTPSPSLAAIDEAIAASRSVTRRALLQDLRAVVAAEVGGLQGSAEVEALLALPHAATAEEAGTDDPTCASCGSPVDTSADLDADAATFTPGEDVCVSCAYARMGRLARGVRSLAARVRELAKVRAEIEAEWEAEMSAEVERVRGVETERDELRATLANERGDGPPLSEEWEFLGHDGPRSTWRRYLVGGGDGPYTAAYVSREIDNYLSRVRWHWYIVRDHPGESPRFTTLAEGYADYAREGMRAADAPTPGGSRG